jgi:hypothetical protein
MLDGHISTCYNNDTHAFKVEKKKEHKFFAETTFRKCNCSVLTYILYTHIYICIFINTDINAGTLRKIFGLAFPWIYSIQGQDFEARTITIFASSSQSCSIWSMISCSSLYIDTIL